MANEELFPLVSLDGTVVGQALRSEVHGNPSLVHPVVHCLVEGPDGRLLLQLRSMTKDVQPGRWDTSVGGHVHFGESITDAAVREIAEEIGVAVTVASLVPLYQYLMRSNIETELVYSFLLRSSGPFVAEPGDISELRFFSLEEIRARLGSGFFTPNFEDEFHRFVEVRARVVL